MRKVYGSKLLSTVQAERAAMEAAVEEELAAEARAAEAEAEKARQAIAAKQQELLELEKQQEREVGGDVWGPGGWEAGWGWRGWVGG